MSKKIIPDLFSDVISAVDEICNEFEAKAPFRHFDDTCWIRDIPIIRDDEIAHVALLLDTERALLAFYVMLQMPEPGDQLNSLVETTALANFGLLPGCFELDFNTGAVRYRCVLAIGTGQCTTRDIAQPLADALMMARRYAPAFQNVVMRDMLPKAAIAEVES